MLGLTQRSWGRAEEVEERKKGCLEKESSPCSPAPELSCAKRLASAAQSLCLCLSYPHYRARASHPHSSNDIYQGKIPINLRLGFSFSRHAQWHRSRFRYAENLAQRSDIENYALTCGKRNPNYGASSLQESQVGRAESCQSQHHVSRCIYPSHIQSIPCIPNQMSDSVPRVIRERQREYPLDSNFRSNR